MNEITQRSALTDTHTFSVAARTGRTSLKMKLAMSSGGLLATAALVSSILLSTAVIVAVATHGSPTGRRRG